MDTARFRAAYDADPKNQGKQSWKDHEEWVRIFYEGKRFPPVPGWNAREKDLLGKVAPADAERVREVLTRVGILLASEWAKDNTVRKVSTADLQAWGKRFGDAKGADALIGALETVEREVQGRA